jgi:hypothetical protein
MKICREMDLVPNTLVQQALVLWLRWNDGFEKVTEQMYSAGLEREQAEQVLDELDQVRREAVRLSQVILNSDEG